MKPVALVGRAIANSSAPGDLVVDPCLGSGTTLLSAHELGRRCYGLEISEKFMEVIVRRWVQATGGEPRLVRDGKEMPWAEVQAAGFDAAGTAGGESSDSEGPGTSEPSAQPTVT